jgi:hypothetical protein
MTSAQRQPDRAAEERKLDLSVVQVAAGALAAVSSAVAASYFSVAGTLLGAALGSVVGTIGTAVYKASLARTNAKLREIVPIQTVVLKRPGNGESTTAVRFAGGAEAPGHPATPTGTTDSTPTDLPGDRAGADTAATGDAALSSDAAGTDTSPARRRWPRLALAALAAFALAVGGVGAVEAVAGQSLSTLVTGDKSKNERVWQVVTPGSSHRDTGPATPTTSPPAMPSETATPAGTPTATPSETVSPTPGSTGSPSPAGTSAPAGTPLGAPRPQQSPAPSGRPLGAPDPQAGQAP